METPHISDALGIVHPLIVERGRNAEVWDEDGNRFIDFIAGIGVLNLGHCHPTVTQAVTEQVNTLMHSAFNAVPHRNYLKLTQALNDFVPVSYSLSCMLTNCGAEATENALKVARAATGRTGTIAFDDGFHGRTLAALNLNGKVTPYKNRLGPLPGPVYHVPFPSRDNGVDAKDAIAALERLFNTEIPSDEVACIIVEPVQGEGGFRVLDAGFAQWLRETCDTLGIVLIVDEIQCGFGRTGEPFAFAALGIEPDLILLGKSIASGLPLAALVGREQIMNSPPRGGLGGTYSGNAVACAAALAVIETMSDDDNLTTWSESQERMIVAAHRRWVASGEFPMVGALTGTGCMRGIVFEDTPDASGAAHLAGLLERARNDGLLLMPSGRERNVLRLLAPLTTEPAIMEEGLAIIENALASQQEECG